MMKKDILIAEEIQSTIETLNLRIDERFPNSGLGTVCRRLHEISKETSKIVQWIEKPNYSLRCGIYLVILLLGIILILTLRQINLKTDGINLSDFVQMTEAGLNEIILIGAGVVALITFENRRKRKRVIRAINRLKCIAHVIDAHQLTKDPYRETNLHIPTLHSPKSIFNSYELGRYLDYCSEMLSLASKLGFLYVQGFDDHIANDAANELEILATGLSRKIWQKIMILRSNERG